MSRTLAFVVLILLAFWFAAENAAQQVVIDFAFFRLRVSLPLLVFGSILLGMGLSAFVGWRASRRPRPRAEPGAPGRPRAGDRGVGWADEVDAEEPIPRERAPFG